MGLLIDLMGESLTGLNPAPGPAYSPQENAEHLAMALGGGRAASRHLGVPESTFRGWRKGTRVKNPAVAANLGREARLAAAGGRYARARNETADVAELAIRGTITVSSDTRIRTVHPGRLIPTPLMRRILTYWAKGADETAEKMLNNAIETYYHPLEFDTIEQVWFE